MSVITALVEATSSSANLAVLCAFEIVVEHCGYVVVIKECVVFC